MKNRVLSVIFTVTVIFAVVTALICKSALGLQTEKISSDGFSLTVEEYEKIQDGLIDLVLSWHGLTYEECALEFFGMVYDKMIVDEFWISGNPPSEYDGKCPMFTSPGVWNENYINMYASCFLSTWGFSYSLEEFKEYIRARLAAETAAEEFVPDKSDINTPISVDVDFFKDVLNKGNQTLTPKNRDVVKYSWRDLSDSQQYYNSNQLGRLIGRNHRFLDKSSYSNGVYIQYYGRVPGSAYQVPQEGVDDYYSPFQYHIYLETITEDGFTDSCGASYPHTKYEWHCDALYYLMIDGERSYHLDTVMTTFEDTMSGDTYRSAYKDFMYMNIGFMHSEYSARFVYCYPYNNAASAHKGLGTPFWDISSVSELFQFSPKKFLMSDDVLKNIDIGTFLYYSSRSGFFGSGISNKDVTANLTDFYTYHPDDDIFDYGFYASTEPFTTTYMFDITRLPSNSTVTIIGDSVYDYSITDNSTGDTSTIYNYVTNNYEYPERPDNNTSGGSGSGGSVGGNITVGGQVDVGGKVEIDVNINGGGAVGNSYDLPDMSPLDSYLDEAISQSSGIRSFLGTFFGFLPAEIVVLLGIGLTVAILARIWGR